MGKRQKKGNTKQKNEVVEDRIKEGYGVGEERRSRNRRRKKGGVGRAAPAKHGNKE